MREILAKILYLFYYFKVHKESKRTDSVLSIYGHDISRKNFEELVKWLLKRNYKFITPYELQDYFCGKFPCNKRYVWMSFDDGWRSNYENVFPVLKKYAVPATIFVATKGIEDGYFWFDKAFENRDSQYYDEIQELWEMPNSKRVEIISKLPYKITIRKTMIPAELKKMTESGLVYWGNHTDDHVMSDNCTDEELATEIMTCQEKMKKWTGVGCNFIYSYPNGNIDDRSEKTIKNLGFKLATTTELNRIYHDTYIFRIPRMEFKDASLTENILHIYGIWTPFFNRMKKVFGIKNKK